MTTERTPERRIYDADRAREVLENDAYQQAFAEIQQEITEQWKNSPVRDEEGRRELYLMLKLSQKLQVTLEGMLTDGKIARTELDYRAQQDARERAHGVLTG